MALVESEDDALVLRYHGFQALAFPGFAFWREDRDAPFLDDIGMIHVVLRPGQARPAGVPEWLSRSRIRHRATLITPPKTLLALHREDTAGFASRWQVTRLSGGIPWLDAERGANTAANLEAWNQCDTLAVSPDILSELDTVLARLGVAGERPIAKIVYLAVTSRVFDERPVSLVIKGASSGGKSYVVEQVLRLFPPRAYFTLTAMSERALAYTDEPLQHRHLVIFEQSGVSSRFIDYLLRSLLSEGRVRYLTPKGLRELEGPTGLLITTTNLSLHAENETRLLTLTITDTPAQTKAVLQALGQRAQGKHRDDVDLQRWHALQLWLQTGSKRVVIPFAAALMDLIPPRALRLRRDGSALLGLIAAHALLHQTTRTKDKAERIVATVTDYAATRPLIADVIAAGTEAIVRPIVRETVEAVAALIAEGAQEVGLRMLAVRLELDPAPTYRRVEEAIAQGFLRNLEPRRKQRRRMRLVLDEPLPDAVELLPSVSTLQAALLRYGVPPDEEAPLPPLG